MKRTINMLLLALLIQIVANPVAVKASTKKTVYMVTEKEYTHKLFCDGKDLLKGEFDISEKFTYKNGLLTKRVANGPYGGSYYRGGTRTYTFKYDSRNRIKTATVIEKNKKGKTKVKYTYSYTYDKKDLLKTVKENDQINKINTVYKYQYDSKKRIKKIVGDGNDFAIKLTYNSKGLVSSAATNAQKYTFSFDKYNNYNSYKSVGGNSKFNETFTNKYDKNKCLIESYNKSDYEDDDNYTVKKRRIDYRSAKVSGSLSKIIQKQQYAILNENLNVSLQPFPYFVY